MQLIIFNNAYLMFSFVEASFDVSLAGGIEGSSRVDSVALEPCASLSSELFRQLLATYVVLPLHQYMMSLSP